MQDDIPRPYTETLRHVQLLAADIDNALNDIAKELEAAIAMPAEEAMRQAETDANHLREKVSLLTLQHKSQQAQIKWLEKRWEDRSLGIS